MLKLRKLRVDNQKAPVGVDKIPEFSWVLSSERRNVVQKSYRLLIARDADFEQTVFDSGEVESDQSVHVKPKGFEPESCTSYFFKVRVTDNYNETSPWETGRFVTALGKAGKWDAAFVTVDQKGSDSKGTYVRGNFSVSKELQEAYVCATALGVYHFYCNGHRVGNDYMTPGWTSYRERLCYQMYDITDYLHPGKNTAGAILAPGWYKGTVGFLKERNLYGTRTAFSCCMILKYRDGSRQIVSSDSTWQGTNAPVIFSEIYDGETYDARQEIPDWCLDTSDASSWIPVDTVPLPSKVVEAQSGCTVKVMEEIPAKRIFKAPNGDTILDFGQNLTGFIKFRIQGYEGAKAELNCFEILDQQGNMYIDNLRGAKATLTYYCKNDAATVYEPYFVFQGFQYARIAEYPGKPEVEDFTACVLYSDMEKTGSFVCSNPDLNQLQHNIEWSMKGNFLDVPTDCPQRDERLGWTGDAQIFCPTACFLMNADTFYRKWLKDLAADQTEEGGVPHVVPNIFPTDGRPIDNWLMNMGTHSGTAWADAAVIVPWNLYLAYADEDVLETQYESMKGWVEFMRSHSSGVIWEYRLQLADWVALDAEEGSYFGATPAEFVCAVYYIYSTRLLAKTASVLGKQKDAEEYSQLESSLQKEFVEKFFDGEGNLNIHTQTAYIISLYFGLVPDKFREKTVEHLLDVWKKEDGHLVTGFVGTPYFTHALSQNGHTKEAYELLLKDDFPSWLYQVKRGATTIWEHWDGIRPDGTMWSPDMNSFNHYAYGAIGEWLYTVTAGIGLDEREPGYKHTVIQPHIGGDLTFVRSKINTMYGRVEVQWDCCENQVTLQAEVPANTTASIILTDVLEILSDDGVEFERDGAQMRGRVGSGRYRITYKMKN